MAACPFCQPPFDRIVLQNERSLAILDGYPVTPGHTLVIPRRHVSSIFELSIEELGDVWKMIDAVRTILLEKHRPQGLNIGINDGAAAGQTIDHAHIHLIPRCRGDVEDPRGGVRWVIPSKAVYWSSDK